jgi:hypothetical protein
MRRKAGMCLPPEHLSEMDEWEQQLDMTGMRSLPNAAEVTARLLSNEPTFWAFDIFMQSNAKL